jgi:hypothetical protein
MPVYVTIRESESGAVQEVILDDLKERIRTGELGPKVQLKDGYWTANEWWTLDNLRLFHSSSPNYHTPGPHLAAKLHRESEKEAAEESVRAWQKKVSESLPDDFLERCYGTKKLSALWAERRSVGIARLVERPAFGYPRFTTLFYGSNSAEAEVIETKQNPYSSVGAAYGAPWLPLPDWSKTATEFSELYVDLWKSDTNHRKLPNVFRSWVTFVETCRKADDCSTPTLDGIGFIHEILDADVHVTAAWSNPSPREHALQISLVEAYRSFVPKRFGRSLRRRNTKT